MINPYQLISYGLCGASGCGKTTLLKAIVGAISLNSGEIFIGDQRRVKNRKLKTTIGFMPQEVALLPDLTIAEVLKFFGLIYNLSEQCRVRNVKFYLEFFELSDSRR